jgi:acyl-CoA synthetase (AMP-forming)/AMP-acid ligase II
MRMARAETPSLWDYVANAPAARFFSDRAAAACYTDVAHGTSLGSRLAELAGRSVLLATASQLTTALALIALDGRARRLTILPPDLEHSHLGAVLTGAEIDAVVLDRGTPQLVEFDFPVRVACAPSNVPTEEVPPVRFCTEWLLLTSGTTGAPKLVAHTFANLTSATAVQSVADGAAVWGTFYDIRRYGGLQIFLRAVIGGASLILSSAGEPVGDHLARLARHGVTHLSGTPSHWRRALMNPAIRTITPHYIRLSGEIAEQAVLDALRAAFPNAVVGHAYASTEAGVAFDVNDGLAGFPVAFVDCVRDGVEMKVVDGSLHIRSPRTASRYIGTRQSLADDEGFVDTGDIIEQRGNRYYFIGRKDGIINIGGLKVHPEEVEAVINRHRLVCMSRVRSKKSPITGSIVVADVVLKAQSENPDSQQIGIRDDILRFCREALPRHKVPAAISFVSSLAVAATGKLARRHG